MKAIYLGTGIQEFKNNMLKAMLEFYGDLEYREYTNSIEMEIPFADTGLWMASRYNFTILVISDKDTAQVTNEEKQLFHKKNNNTLFTLLILKDNSITLFEGDSSNVYGGESIYSILNTDKGLVFFSACKSPGNIDICKSICVESGKDLTPVTFGNQALSSNNEVLKQPFRLTDADGKIYTALDIYNISYKPEAFTALPKSFISSWNLANKDNPQEPIMTSLLIYDEEEEG